MTIAPDYFRTIVDELDPEFIPEEFVACIRLYLASGAIQELTVDDFNFLFESAMGAEQEIGEYLKCNRVAMVLDHDAIYVKVKDIVEPLLARFPV